MIALCIWMILIVSKHLEEHLEHLREVFERLRRAGLKSYDKDKQESNLKLGERVMVYMLSESQVPER